MMSRKWIAAVVAILILAGSSWAGPKKLLLIGTPPDNHPPMTHEYMPGLKLLAKLLKEAEGLEVMVEQAVGPWKHGPELIGRSDGVVLFLTEGAKWLQQDRRRTQALQKVAGRKGGLSVLHWGMGTRKAEPIADFLRLFGACHGGPDRKYIVIDVKLKLPNPGHPSVQGVKPFGVKDEFYYRLKKAKDGKMTALLKAPIGGNDEMVSWAWERPDGGRSFGFSGLHFHKNWARKEYRRLVTQGVLWAMKIPVPKGGLKVEVTDKDIEARRLKKSGE